MLKKLRLPALILLLVGAAITIQKCWSSLRESHIHSRIESRLIEKLPELADENWRIYLDGSEGIIHGTVSSQSLYSDAATLISKLTQESPDGIHGLEALECALTVPYHSSIDLSIDDESGTINLVGEIPADAAATITAALSGAFPTGNIKEDVKISSGKITTAPWADALGEIAPTLVRSIGDLSIKLEHRAITISGSVANESSRNQIQQLLLKHFAGSIDYVRNGLTSLEDEIETSYLSVAFTEADTIVLNGHVQSKSTRDQLVRGIEAISPAGFLVESRLKIRPAATGSWWTRPTLAFLQKTFPSLHGSDFRVDASGVFIQGLQATSDEQLAITSLARNYFPNNIYTFNSELNPDYNPPTDPTTPLLASAEEPVTTPIDTEEIIDPPQAVVEIETDIEPPAETPETSETPETPTGTGIAELVTDTMIFFSSGSSRVRETESEKLTILAEQLANAPELKIDVRGVADPVGNATSNRRLAEKRCRAVLLALEKSGIEPSRLKIVRGGERSPQKGEPSWKLRRVEFAIHQDPAAIEIASTEPIITTHIYFGKNRTNLTLEERSKLDRIAATLKEAPPGVLGISGFTDPKGNRYYNERLSKSRCQTVHDYLIEQGVPDTRLRTQPGGELTSPDASEPSWKLRRVQFQWIKLATSN